MTDPTSLSYNKMYELLVEGKSATSRFAAYVICPMES